MITCGTYWNFCSLVSWKPNRQHERRADWPQRSSCRHQWPPHRAWSNPPGPSGQHLQLRSQCRPLGWLLPDWACANAQQSLWRFAAARIHLSDKPFLTFQKPSSHLSSRSHSTKNGNQSACYREFPNPLVFFSVVKIFPIPNLRAGSVAHHFPGTRNCDLSFLITVAVLPQQPILTKRGPSTGFFKWILAVDLGDRRLRLKVPAHNFTTEPSELHSSQNSANFPTSCSSKEMVRSLQMVDGERWFRWSGTDLQKSGDGHSDHVAAADHNSMLACDGHARSQQELYATSWGAGHVQRRPALQGQFSHVQGMEPIHVLLNINSSKDLLLVHMLPKMKSTALVPRSRALSALLPLHRRFLCSTLRIKQNLVAICV